MTRILSKRERLILSVTIGIIIFALVFNFVLAPVLAKNEARNKEINLTRAKLKRYLWLLSQKAEIESKYAKFSSLAQVLGPQEGGLVGALTELESLAKDAGIRIIDVRPQAQAKNLEAYKEVLIDVRLEGSMDGYLKFIYNLENSLSLLRIKRFQLTAKPNNPALEGTFTISKLSLE